MFRRLLASLVVLSIFAIGNGAFAGVINGDFESWDGSSFDGWSTLPFFDGPDLGSDADGNFAILRNTGANLSGQMEQAFSIPSNGTLFFDFLYETTLATPAEDAFQATLFDATGSFGLLPTGDPFFRPGFLLADRTGIVETSTAFSDSGPAADLRLGWTRAQVDLSSIAGEDTILDFNVFNAFFALGDSTVYIDNVVLQSSAGVIPEPVSATTWLGLAAGVALSRRRAR